MNSAVLLEVFSIAGLVALKVAAPILITALAIGLLVSLFQALTQINESTLAFLPKVLALALVGWLAMPWLVQVMVTFTVRMLSMASEAAR
ncbi:MAG: flagellar biosynthetic protein FliQ [Planctomycetota bacterium]|nr:flagellar biosynthetic protein FliQ [Planctomycetota bacterium]